MSSISIDPEDITWKNKCLGGEYLMNKNKNHLEDLTLRIFKDKTVFITLLKPVLCQGLCGMLGTRPSFLCGSILSHPSSLFSALSLL